MVNKQLLTVKELQDYLNCCSTIAYRLVHTDGFPVVRLGRKILVPVDRLNEWLEKQGA